MAFKIDFSEQAAADLSEIILYISDDLCNPQAAERFYKAVNKTQNASRTAVYVSGESR